MITNTGKEIVAKYLLGTAPAFASYMAFGSGPQPLGSADSHSFNTYAQKELLDFEMFRVPISSRGYVYEDGVNKLVFTAELPSQERYEITEIGIYSAGSNPSAAGFDSRNLVLFSQEEAWQSVTASTASIPVVTTPLDSQDDNVIDVAYDVFQANADNRTFYNPNRDDYHERCRFFNNVILVAGDFSSIKDATSSTDLSSVYHISKTGTSINLSQNSLSDKIKIAFSVINQSAALTLSTPYTGPDSVKIIVDFINTSTKKARLIYNVTHTGTKSINNKSLTSNVATLTTSSSHSFAVGDKILVAGVDNTFDGTHIITSTTSTTFSYSKTADNVSSVAVSPVGQAVGIDFSTNRYYAVEKNISDAVQEDGFSWADVTSVKIYACAVTSNALDDNYYIGLDAIRVDNVTTQNPLYGLTAYTIVKNSEEQPILKASNTNNYIEYRMSVGVQ